MKQDNRTDIVAELTKLIKKGNAHVSFNEAVAGLPENLRTTIPGDLPYSIWQLVEHMRITQKDILDFCKGENYLELNWPDDYWTENKDVLSNEVWENSLREITEDRDSFLELLKNDQNDLFSAFEWGDGRNLFREALLISDHNSYHTGEIILLRRLLKSWR